MAPPPPTPPPQPRLRSFAAAAQLALERRLAGKVLNDGFRALPGYQYDFFDAAGDSLFDGVLDERLVHQRQHLLWHGLGGRKESRPQPCHRNHGFAHESLHRRPLPFVCPPCRRRGQRRATGWRSRRARTSAGVSAPRSVRSVTPRSKGMLSKLRLSTTTPAGAARQTAPPGAAPRPRKPPSPP